MFSAWMVGLEDEPDRCGEICLVEVFGDAVDGRPGRGRVGNPPLPRPAPRRGVLGRADDDRRHAAAPLRVDWRPGRVEFFVDDERTRVCAQAPDYPMQLILGVFDFPDRRSAGEAAVPELVVHRVRGTP